MPSQIRTRFHDSTPLEITLAGLASSTSGAGRQSAVVDNTAAGHNAVHLFVKVTLGTSPAAHKTVQVYLLQGDGTGLRTDGAGAADAPITVRNAPLLGVLTSGSAPSSGLVLQKQFVISDPGPQWAIAIVHDTGAPLASAPEANVIRFVGQSVEVL